MSKKQEFVKYVREVMHHCSTIEMNEDARLYWEAFSNQSDAIKPLFTDNGKLILKYLQDNQQNTSYRAKDIAEGLGIGSRVVSGAMNKLVSDGYVEKIGQDPVIYALTDNGKNIIIN